MITFFLLVEVPLLSPLPSFSLYVNVAIQSRAVSFLAIKKRVRGKLPNRLIFSVQQHPAIIIMRNKVDASSTEVRIVNPL